MADETNAPEPSAPAAPPSSDAQSASMRSVLLGSSVVIWILAIFMIVTLNSIKGQLTKLNDQVQGLMSVTSQANLGSYQVTDQDGKVVYNFKRIPESMPPGEGAACPAPAATPPKAK